MPIESGIMIFLPIANPLFEKPPGWPDLNNMDLIEFQKYIESLNIFDYGDKPPSYSPCWTLLSSQISPSSQSS
jgi:hypothetical protein